MDEQKAFSDFLTALHEDESVNNVVLAWTNSDGPVEVRLKFDGHRKQISVKTGDSVEWFDTIKDVVLYCFEE